MPFTPGCRTGDCPGGSDCPYCHGASGTPSEIYASINGMSQGTGLCSDCTAFNDQFIIPQNTMCGWFYTFPSNEPCGSLYTARIDIRMFTSGLISRLELSGGNSVQRYWWVKDFTEDDEPCEFATFDVPFSAYIRYGVGADICDPLATPTLELDIT